MTRMLSSRWMPFLLRGLVALLVGILAICWPVMTLLSLSLLFALLALMDGVALIISGVRTPGRNRFLLLAGGFMGTAMGCVMLVVPGLSLLAISFLIAGWAIGTGASETMTGWRLRSEMNGEWLWIIAGLLSIVFGVFVALKPAIGVAFLVYAVSAYAFLSAFVLIALAFRMRALDSSTNSALDTTS